MIADALVRPETGPRSSRSGRAGFTLMEVLVALGILGTGVFVLLENHYASMQLLVDAQEEGAMRFLVQRAVAEVEQQVILGESEGAEEFGERYPGFTYSYTATPFNEDEAPGLFEVVVTVAGPQEEREIRFYIFDGTQIENEDVS